MKPFRRVLTTAAVALLLVCPATARPGPAAETVPGRTATQAARSPTPRPTPRPRFVLGPATKTHGVSPALEALLSDVAQPAKLRAGTQGSCHDHTTADAKIAACEKDVAAGRALVVWDWSSASCARKPCVRDVDGFHLWRASSSAATGSVSATIAAPSSYYVFAERAKDIVGSCFRVSAFKGNSDGPRSASYCATAPPPTSATVKLQTDYAYTTVYHGKWQWHPPNSDTAPCAGIGYVYPPLPKVSGAFAVGNRDGISMAGTGDPTLPCAYDQHLYRTAIQFAVTDLRGKKIDKALLHLDVVSGLYDQAAARCVRRAAARMRSACPRTTAGRRAARSTRSSGRDCRPTPS
jgi:hypothetical protein